VAGLVSALVFAIIHHIFISNIWFSLLIMVFAGAACGLCIGWTYGLIFPSPIIRSWVLLNLLFVTMFALLGIVSVLVYEPVTSIAALVFANEPPDELIRLAMPMTVVFTMVMALAVSLVFGRNWKHYAAIFITCVTLVLFLGLNVSVIGLVTIPVGSFYLVLELFALILALDLVYAAVFLGLERDRFFRKAQVHPVV